MRLPPVHHHPSPPTIPFAHTYTLMGAHRGAATLDNLVAGRWLSIDESKQGDADRIQMRHCSDLWASRTDNTVYIINHVAKLISRR